MTVCARAKLTAISHGSKIAKLSHINVLIFRYFGQIKLGQGVFLAQTRGSASHTFHLEFTMVSLSYMLDLFQLLTPLYMYSVTQPSLLSDDIRMCPAAHIM